MWWILGVWQLMFFAMTVPMLRELMRYRSTLMPRGFGVWLMWLAWLLTGLFVMQVHAPGTLPDSSLTAYLPFAYRFAWYVAATVVALYVVNARPRISPEWISRVLAWFFVILVAGGLLGLAAPNLDFPSLLQAALPRGLAKQALVQDLLHVQVAQVQAFLGDPQARPSAPFPFTNEWGLVIACTLPYFVAAWWHRGRTWRVAAVVVLIAAGIAIISSLNRGTWVAVLAMAAFLILRSAALGKVRLLALAVGLVVAAGALVLVTPLGDLVQARLDSPHSDQVRSNLGIRAATTAAQASPVIGFGTTRDVAGNFVSIAGGATAACPNCVPPPLGTHGQLWLLIFGAGFVGAGLYVIFLVGQLVRHLGTRSPTGVAALCSLLTLTITLPVYSAVGVGLFIGFVGVGVLSREHDAGLATIQDITRPLLRRSTLVATCVLVGGAGGVMTHVALGSPVVATQRLFIPDADLGGVPGTRATTLDTEAHLATSDAVVRAVAAETGAHPSTVRDRLVPSAATNTRVLILSYTSDDQDEAVRSVETASQAYLDERQSRIAAANRSLEDRLTRKRDDLTDLYRAIYPYRSSNQNQIVWPELYKIREDLDETDQTLLETKEAASGESISAAIVTRSSDPAVIRVGSGLAIGFLVGVPLILIGDRYWLRFGSRRSGPSGLPIPVITTVGTHDADAAVRALRAYPPAPMVIADPAHASAMRLASSIEEKLTRSPSPTSRAVYVVDQRSRVSRVRQMYRHHAGLGVEPLGVIVCRSTNRSRRRRRPRFRSSSSEG
ncbi:hypothetical protein [Janibacter corallicola]|uniref:hypothetical protein n=1 Tax=Janibacter corallicola TaxID=415212 RepID=UPI0012EE318C|nr:hypothetical protein [Janibacter corallicola]